MSVKSLYSSMRDRHIDMYVKVALIALALFAVVRPEQVPFAGNVKDAEHWRFSTTPPLLSSHHNEQHPVKAKTKKRSLYLLMPLLKTQLKAQYKPRQPREVSHKTKRCGTYLRNKNPEMNVRGISKEYSNAPYAKVTSVFSQNASKNIATTTTSGMEIRKAREESGSLLRALKDIMKVENVLANADSLENAQECGSYICHCRPVNRLPSSRLLGSPYRRIKVGQTNYRRPTERKLATPYFLQSEPPSYEGPYQSYVLGPINSVPVGFYDPRGTHRDLYAPFLYGTSFILPHLMINGRELVGVPLASFAGRPDFLVGNDLPSRDRLSFREFPHSILSRYPSEHVRAESPMGNTQINSAEGNAITKLPDVERTESYTRTDELGKLKGEVRPTSSTVFAVNYVEVTQTTTESNFELYSSSRKVGGNSNDFFTFTTPKTHYASIKTPDPEVGSAFSSHLPETITMSAITRPSDKSTSPWTTDWSNAKATSSFDSSTNYFGLTKSSIGRNHLLSKLHRFGGRLLGEATPSSIVSKNVPNFLMKKLTERIDKVEKNTRNNLVGKSRSKNPVIKMLVGASNDDESTNQPNAAMGEGSFDFTISNYETTIDKESKYFTTTIRNDLRKNLLSSSRRGQPKGSARVSDLQSGRVADEENTGVSMKSSRRGDCRKKNPRKQLTGARNPGRSDSDDDDDIGDVLEYTTESLMAVTNLPTSSKPALFDTDLLLNSVKKVINDIVLSNDNNVGSAKSESLDENAILSQGESLLPGILGIPNLGDILLAPRMEDVIVERVRNILLNVLSESRLDFTNNGLRGMIRNALRSLLKGPRVSEESDDKKSSSIKVEEHQFKDGRWQTSLVTLTSVAEHGEQSMTPKDLLTDMKNLLEIPAVASQTDRSVARNMIENLRDGLINEVENETGESRAGNPIISDTLSDMLETPRDTEKPSMKGAPKKSDEKVEVKLDDDENRADSNVSRKMPGVPISSDMRKSLEVEARMSDDQTQKTSYQKAKAFQDDLKILATFEPPNLAKPEQLQEEKNVSPSSEITVTPLISRTGAETPDVKETGNNEDIMTYRQSTSFDDDASVMYEITTLPKQPNSPEDEEERVETHSPQETIMSLTSEDIHLREGIAQDGKDEMENNETQHKEASAEILESQTVSSRINGMPEEANTRGTDATSTIEDASSRAEEATLTCELSKTFDTQKTNLSESNDVLSSGTELASTTKILGSDESMMADSYKTPAEEVAEQNISTLDSISEASDEYDLATLTDGEAKISMAESSSDDDFLKKYFETTEISAMNPTVSKYLSEYSKIDPLMLLEEADANEPPITYYSPKNRILDYIKTHQVDESEEITTTAASVVQKSSSDDEETSNGTTSSQDTAVAETNNRNKEENESNGIASSTNCNSISSVNENYESRKAEIILPLLAEGTRSGEQPKLTMGDLIKVHEVTTEMQKTYAKTTYYQLKSQDLESNSGTNLITYESKVSADGNDNNNGESIADEISRQNIATEANERIVSAIGPSSDDTYSLQLFPSSITSADRILQLQKSQLYYVNDDMKLPLEIRRLKDGSYALSISKNICELILKRNCPACVPLRENVAQLSRRDVMADNVKEDCQSSIAQPLPSTPTKQNLSKEMFENSKGEGIAGANISNDRKKRSLVDDDDNDPMTIFSMSVLDFARKYNLSLDFDEKMMSPGKNGSRIEIRIPDNSKSIIEDSKSNRITKILRNDETETKENKLQNERQDEVESLRKPRTTSSRKKKNILDKNGNLRDAELCKTCAAVNRSEIKESELHELKKEYDGQKINAESTTNLDNQTNNFISDGFNIFEENSISKNEGVKSGNAEIPVKKKEEKPEEVIDVIDSDERTTAKIKTSNKKCGRPYRYQRNTHFPNKGVKIVTNLLYWLRSLILDK